MPQYFSFSPTQPMDGPNPCPSLEGSVIGIDWPPWSFGTSLSNCQPKPECWRKYRSLALTTSVTFLSEWAIVRMQRATTHSAVVRVRACTVALCEATPSWVAWAKDKHWPAAKALRSVRWPAAANSFPPQDVKSRSDPLSQQCCFS